MAAQNGQEVNLQLQTAVTQDGQTNHHTFKGPAVFVKVGSAYYLRYEEEKEGTKVTFKMTEDNQLTILRAGETQTRLRFQLGVDYPSEYHTPHGKMLLSTQTKDMSFLIDETNGTGEMKLTYHLTMGTEKLGDYKLQLQFSP